MMLKKMRSPKVTARSVSFTLAVSTDGCLTRMSSFNVTTDFHRSGRCSVVFVVEVENKGDGPRRSDCVPFDLPHNDVRLLMGEFASHDFLKKGFRPV